MPQVCICYRANSRLGTAAACDVKASYLICTMFKCNKVQVDARIRIAPEPRHCKAAARLSCWQQGYDRAQKNSTAQVLSQS